MILLADVIVAQIEVCLFGYLHTGVAEDLAEREDVHAGHQASLGVVVPKTVWSILLVQSGTLNVLLEVAFKVADSDGAAVFLDRE